MSDHEILTAATVPDPSEATEVFAARLPASAAGRDFVLAAVAHGSPHPPCLQTITQAWVKDWDGHNDVLRFARDPGLAFGAWTFPIASVEVDAAWQVIMAAQSSGSLRSAYVAVSPLQSSPEIGGHFLFRVATTQWDDQVRANISLPCC
jgi:hypothetical protein